MTKYILVCYTERVNKGESPERYRYIMTTKEYAQLFEQTIDNNELHGRSFTLGRALYTLLAGGYFAADSDELMEIEHQLAEHLSYELGTTTDRVYETLNTRAMAEAVDIALLDEIARELSGEAEA